jgi:uroporphyrin-III C-methyltransferase
MTVYFIGAGPGDPELLTRKAWRILGQSDVIFYDALLDADGVREAAPNAQWIHVGKRVNQVSTAQGFISRSLVSYAQRGFRVARLKGGDPSIFGRLTEETDACRAAGLEIEIVPGVTAACAAAAELGIGLTERAVARSVVFLTPRTERSRDQTSDHWLESALHADTAVMYMAGQEITRMSGRLIAAGRSAHTPVALVESASRNARTHRTTLGMLANGEIATARFDGPVTIILGDVARPNGSSSISHFIHPSAGHETTTGAKAIYR